MLYDDAILKSIPLVFVTDEKKEVQQTVQSMVKKGNTDIGLTLKEAVNMLSQETQEQNIIVLFSDGETDLKAIKTGRTMQNSYVDEALLIKKLNKTVQKLLQLV